MPVGIFLVQFQKPFPLKSLFLSVSVTSVYPGQKPQVPCLSPGLVLKLYGVRVGGGGGRAWTFIRVGTFSTVQDICLPCTHTHLFMDIQSWGNSRKQNFEEKKRDFEREREKYLIVSLYVNPKWFSPKKGLNIFFGSLSSLWINQCSCCLNLLSWKPLACRTAGSCDVLRVKHRDPRVRRWHRLFIKSGCMLPRKVTLLLAVFLQCP